MRIQALSPTHSFSEGKANSKATKASSTFKLSDLHQLWGPTSKKTIEKKADNSSTDDVVMLVKQSAASTFTHVLCLVVLELRLKLLLFVRSEPKQQRCACKLNHEHIASELIATTNPTAN
jgi:hypothetical protein